MLCWWAAGVCLECACFLRLSGLTILSCRIKEGFAPVTSHNLIALWLYDVIGNPLVFSVLVANSPQLILAIICFMFNALFTCYLRAGEWTKMAVQPKALRVTQPQKDQRSTYWLQLPFRYAVPLNIVSGGLHALASQSIYLIAIETWERGGFANPGDSRPRYTISCAFSPLGIITVLLLAPVLLVVACWLGCRKYPTGMPAYVANSAIISAACHRLSQEEGLEMDPVRWGVVEHDDGRRTLAFSREPQEPMEGEVYW